MKEKNIQTLTQIAMGKFNALCVNRTVGTFYTRMGNPIKIGTPGEADLQGIIPNQRCPNCDHPIHPAPYALEIKAEKGRLRPAQITWRDRVWAARGGIYRVIRDPSEIPEALKDYLP